MIVILGVKDVSTNIVYNFLSRHFIVDKVIIESKVSFKTKFKRRVKKLGFFKSIGQLIFQLVIQQLLNLVSKKRSKEIIIENELCTDNIPEHQIKYVQSVNDDHTIEEILAAAPKIIVVSGTRIISKKVLKNCPSLFLNIHAGITPKYRGVHGAYWALASNDNALCGVTLHKIDEGIDTGEVIQQALIQPTKKDNFCTYPLLQLSTGLDLLLKAIHEFNDNKLVYRKSLTQESKLWYHPTFFQYCLNFFVRNVK